MIGQFFKGIGRDEEELEIQVFANVHDRFITASSGIQIQVAK